MGVENEDKNNLNFANKVFNRQEVLILVGLNSGISLYLFIYLTPYKHVFFFISSFFLFFFFEKGFMALSRVQ